MARSQLPFLLLCSLLVLPSMMLEGLEIPGRLLCISVTQEGVKEAAAFAVEQYNQRSNNTGYYKELSIAKAQSQVVAGTIYYLTVELGLTACPKTDEPIPFRDIQKCELLPSDQEEKVTCDFRVWSGPWTNDRHLLSSNCS